MKPILYQDMAKAGKGVIVAGWEVWGVEEVWSLWSVSGVCGGCGDRAPYSALGSCSTVAVPDFFYCVKIT